MKVLGPYYIGHVPISRQFATQYTCTVVHAAPFCSLQNVTLYARRRFQRALETLATDADYETAHTITGG